MDKYKFHISNKYRIRVTWLDTMWKKFGLELNKRVDCEKRIVLVGSQNVIHTAPEILCSVLGTTFLKH